MTSAAKRRKRKSVSVAPMPFNGDHGTGTSSANTGTVLVPVTHDGGKNPNRMARRTRYEVWRAMSLTMRQQQAAEAIRTAYCRVQMLSSGSPLKERVQASPKPDMTIDIQVDAQSRLVHVMRGVPRGQRPIIEHVIWANKPFRALTNAPRCRARFRSALDAVADHLCY